MAVLGAAFVVAEGFAVAVGTADVAVLVGVGTTVPEPPSLPVAPCDCDGLAVGAALGAVAVPVDASLLEGAVAVGCGAAVLGPTEVGSAVGWVELLGTCCPGKVYSVPKGGGGSGPVYKRGLCTTE